VVQKVENIFLKTELESFSGITLKEAGNMLDKDRRKYIQEVLGISCIYFGKQIHSNNIKIVGSSEKNNFFEETDGLLTFEKQIFLGIFVADCYPVFLEGKEFVGIIHCGFKGVKDGIIEKFFRILSENSVDFNKINAFIGPGICVKHYWINLKKIIKAKLEVFCKNTIKSFNICTFEDKRFFSFRRDKTSFRNLSIIGRC